MARARKAEPLAGNPDRADRAGGFDVGGRIVGEQHEVGAQSRLDPAAVGQPEVTCGEGAGGIQRLGGGEPGIDQQLELVVQALAEHR